MNVLITGADGFVGSHLIKSISNDHNAIAQVRNVIAPTSNRVSFFELNITGRSDWKAYLSDVNVVIHLASIAHNKSNDLNYINDVNVEGTVNLAKQAVDAGVKRFIFISSIAVVGNKTYFEQAFDESSVLAPDSQCAQTKVDAEKALLKIADETDLEVVIIRPVLIFGANAPGNFGKLVNLVKKMPILPFALCRNKRSFISVDNLVDFISICVEHPKAKNEIFCISDSDDISIKDFTNGIAVGLRKNLIQIPVPMFVFKLLGKITGKSEKFEQLVGDLQVDSSKARQLLGWTPSVSMVETFSKLTKTQ